MFAYPTSSDPCILVRTGADSYVAYSQKCTGHRDVAVPGAIISGILSAACLGLYLLVDRIDSEVRKG